MSTLPPPGPPGPPQRQPDPILASWDRSFRSVFRLVGTLFYVGMISLCALFWLMLVFALGDSDSDLAGSYLVWSIGMSFFVWRLYLRRRTGVR